ncbi:hypothetical protein AK830_g6666 [Neonectria ditissima]|uniref:Uncharacterized protein n=1 Tax=Neonectria ditissima TaxID=78410 RepID=A0A0P7AZK4_9HYPO|nr:hypothetical protein AK830_g6666 [Neonectria ditissima]
MEAFPAGYCIWTTNQLQHSCSCPFHSPRDSIRRELRVCVGRHEETRVLHPKPRSPSHHGVVEKPGSFLHVQAWAVEGGAPPPSSRRLRHTPPKPHALSSFEIGTESRPGHPHTLTRARDRAGSAQTESRSSEPQACGSQGPWSHEPPAPTPTQTIGGRPPRATSHLGREHPAQPCCDMLAGAGVGAGASSTPTALACPPSPSPFARRSTADGAINAQVCATWPWGLDPPCPTAFLFANIRRELTQYEGEVVRNAVYIAIHIAIHIAMLRRLPKKLEAVVG